MIRSTDRVARVLERDERLIEVFAAASPHFERLRDRGMRRVMARLVTVEQAARIAGVDAESLVERLNLAFAGSAEPRERPVSEEKGGPMRSTDVPPPTLADLPADRLHDLDVRDDLRSGREPFSRIMAAKRALPRGHVLRLRATFEPAPLYHVLGKKGFAHWTEQLAPDDWRVWFYREAETRSTPSSQTAGGPAAGEADAGEDAVVLDVRGLEPPEPMVRTLAALERLPDGKTLVQINVRVPRFLLPRLDELGYAYEVREQSEDLVRLFIRRPS